MLMAAVTSSHADGGDGKTSSSNPDLSIVDCVIGITQCTLAFVAGSLLFAAATVLYITSQSRRSPYRDDDNVDTFHHRVGPSAD